MQTAVTFVSLFLGLVLGPHQVEVAVADNVARVEILLDGQLLLELEQAPWRGEIDLGDELAPRHLEAVAYDRAGLEIGMAELWLNVPRPSAAARLVLIDPEREQGATRARLTWSSVTGQTPIAIRGTFDGADVPVASPPEALAAGRLDVDLPSHDPDQLHFLRVELDFPENLSASAEMTFGGFFADQVSSELTAVPVRAPRRRGRAPDPSTLDGWLAGPDGPLSVVAAEKGLADVVVVLGGSAPRPLTRLMMQLPSNLRRTYQALEEDQRLYVTSPWPVTMGAEQGTPYNLFTYTRGLTQREGGYLALLSRAKLPRGALDRQRLADALAVAGMNASSRNRRRAVVLLLGPEDLTDQSQLSPGQVRAYLSHLKVPLYVWTLSPASEMEKVRALWPEARGIHRLSDFREAVWQLNQDVEKQRLLWVEGTFLPQWLELTELADKFEPVGG